MQSMYVSCNKKYKCFYLSPFIKRNCNCPAEKCGYWNHVMVLLFQVADYSLRQYKCVREDVSYTSKKRQWGVLQSIKNVQK